MHKLANQVAVITGGGSGIGQAIARSLGHAGCRIALAGRRASLLQEVCAAIEQDGGSAIFRSLDVSDRTEVDAYFAWIADQLGNVDILVHAAGINVPRRAMAVLVPEEWDKIMAVNATGAFNCIHAVLPQMRPRRQGQIFNIVSTSGKRATPLGGIAYCAAKFAQAALGTAVANEMSAEGIRITNVFPGEVDTPILEFRPTPVDAAHRQRILRPADVADMVVAIASLPPHAHVPEIIIKPLSQDYA